MSASRWVYVVSQPHQSCEFGRRRTFKSWANEQFQMETLIQMDARAACSMIPLTGRLYPPRIRCPGPLRGYKRCLAIRCQRFDFLCTQDTKYTCIHMRGFIPLCFRSVSCCPVAAGTRERDQVTQQIRYFPDLRSGPKCTISGCARCKK